MEYVHSFKYSEEISVRAWRNIVADLHTITEKLPMHSETAGGKYQNFPIKIRRESEGISEPEFNWKAIQFNGVRDLGNDCFRLVRLKSKNDDGWITCDTKGLPYDYMVCATLLIIEFHAPGCLEILTDGSREDWLPALSHVQMVLNKPGVRLPSCLRSVNEQWVVFDAPAWF